MGVKSFIKNRLNILLEARFSDHLLTRFTSRILNADVVLVGYELDGSVGQYKIVGTYKIPQLVKTQIEDNIRKVANTNFAKNSDYGVQIGYIPIQPQAVQFTHGSLDECKGRTLVIVDEGSNSNGNVVYLIVRQDVGTTVYFGKNYVPQTTQKMKVDAIIKNIDNYKKR